MLQTVYISGSIETRVLLSTYPACCICILQCTYMQSCSTYWWPLPTYYAGLCAWAKSTKGCGWYAWPIKNAVLQHLWILPNDSKHNGEYFSTILMVLKSCSDAQMPRPWDLVIFVLTNKQIDRQTDRTNCFIPQPTVHYYCILHTHLQAT